MSKLTILAGLAALLSAVSLPAQADRLRSESCIFVRGSMSCVTKWQRWDVQAPQAPTEQELAEIRERERRWQARCRPLIQQDDLGVRRYVYAAPGCEYGRIN
jgi:hypothetical protein